MELQGSLEQNELSPVLGTIATVLQLNIAVEIFFPLRANCTPYRSPQGNVEQSSISREFIATHLFLFSIEGE